MLQITGKCLGVQTETVPGGPNGSFVSTTIHVLSGYETHAVRVGRDFPPADLPKEGEDVTLNVVVSAFSRKGGGAGWNATAMSRATSGARRLAPTGTQG